MFPTRFFWRFGQKWRFGASYVAVECAPRGATRPQTVPIRGDLSRGQDDRRCTPYWIGKFPDMFPDCAKLLTWPPAARNVPPGGSASGLSHFGGPVLGQSWLSRLSERCLRSQDNFANRPRVTRGSLFNLKHNGGVPDATLTPPENTPFYGVQLSPRRVQRANRHFSQNACVRMKK